MKQLLSVVANVAAAYVVSVGVLSMLGRLAGKVTGREAQRRREVSRIGLSIKS